MGYFLTQKYSTFFRVRDDFVPVYTKELDDTNKSAWQSFIPHDTMKFILEDLLNSLDRSDLKKIKPFWIYGAYGTGKTYLTLTIKHILEDPIHIVENYFEKHQNIRSLFNKLKSIRDKKRYIVIYKSGSSHIDNDRRLLLELQRDILHVLKERDLRISTTSIVDEILKKLEYLNWEKLFNDYRKEFPESKDHKDVIEELRKHNLDIAEAIMNVFLKENILLYDNVDDVKKWIEDVIKEKDIAIIFIWDEFSEYFYKNSSYSTLQELAHLTVKVPFYLFLVTHKDPTQIARKESLPLAQKIKDRFYVHNIKMEEVTSYQLLKNAIEIYSQNENEWKSQREILFRDIGKIFNLNFWEGKETLRKNDIIDIIPFHPLSLDLMTDISKLFSSNERTFFKFLTDKESGYAHFIDEYPYVDGNSEYNWLTPDILWDYFFKAENPEEQIPKSFNEQHLVLRCINFLKENGKNFNFQELKVLKTIFLLNILYENTANNSKFDPTKKKLESLFLGENAILSNLDSILNSIIEKSEIRQVRTSGDERYILDVVEDIGELNRYKENIRSITDIFNNEKFNNPLECFYQNFQLSNQEKLRYMFILNLVEENKIKSLGDRIIKDSEPYKIYVNFFIPKNLEDIEFAEENIKKMLKDEKDDGKDQVCYFLSLTKIDDEKWENLRENYARFKYYSELNKPSKEYYFKSIKTFIEEWFSDVLKGKFKFFLDIDKAQEGQGIDSLKTYLNEKRKNVFPLSPENVSIKDTLYRDKIGEKIFKVALGIEEPDRQYKELIELIGIENCLIEEIEKKLDEYFAETKGYIKAIWDKAQSPPIGLMPCPIGIFLFAQYFKKYSKGHYIVDPNNNSKRCSEERLADVLYKVIKISNKKDEIKYYRIKKVSPEAENVCKLLKEYFSLNVNELTPEEIRKKMRSYFADNFPLWSILYFSEKGRGLKDLIESLEKFISYSEEEISEELIKDLSKKLENIRLNSELFFEGLKNLDKGFLKFLILNSGELKELIQELDIKPFDIRNRLKQMLNEDAYLWTEKKVLSKLEQLVGEYNLISKLNNIFGLKFNNILDARNEVSKILKNFKMPLTILQSLQENDREQFSNALNLVHRFIYDDKFGSTQIDSEILKILDNHSKFIKNKVMHPEDTLIKIIDAIFNQKITEQESINIFKDLQDFSREEDSEYFIAELKQKLNMLEKNRIINSIVEKWNSITSSDSPKEWSKINSISITWILRDEYFKELLKKFEELNSLDINILKDILNFLVKNKQHIAENLKQENLKNTFLNMVVPYAAEFVDEEKYLRLKEEIMKKYGDNWYENFEMKAKEISNFAYEYLIKELNIRDSVLVDIMNFDHDVLYNLIAELLKEEPSLTFKLMKFMKKFN